MEIIKAIALLLQISICSDEVPTGYIDILHNNYCYTDVMNVGINENRWITRQYERFFNYSEDIEWAINFIQKNSSAEVKDAADSITFLVKKGDPEMNFKVVEFKPNLKPNKNPPDVTPKKKKDVVEEARQNNDSLCGCGSFNDLYLKPNLAKFTKEKVGTRKTQEESAIEILKGTRPGPMYLEVIQSQILEKFERAVKIYNATFLKVLHAGFSTYSIRGEEYEYNLDVEMVQYEDYLKATDNKVTIIDNKDIYKSFRENMIPLEKNPKKLKPKYPTKDPETGGNLLIANKNKILDKFEQDLEDQMNAKIEQNIKMFDVEINRPLNKPSENPSAKNLVVGGRAKLVHNIRFVRLDPVNSISASDQSKNPPKNNRREPTKNPNDIFIDKYGEMERIDLQSVINTLYTKHSGNINDEGSPGPDISITNGIFRQYEHDALLFKVRDHITNFFNNRDDSEKPDGTDVIKGINFANINNELASRLIKILNNQRGNAKISYENLVTEFFKKDQPTQQNFNKLSGIPELASLIGNRENKEDCFYDYENENKKKDDINGERKDERGRKRRAKKEAEDGHEDEDDDVQKSYCFSFDDKINPRSQLLEDNFNVAAFITTFNRIYDVELNQVLGSIQINSTERQVKIENEKNITIIKFSLQHIIASYIGRKMHNKLDNLFVVDNIVQSTFESNDSVTADKNEKYEAYWYFVPYPSYLRRPFQIATNCKWEGFSCSEKTDKLESDIKDKNAGPNTYFRPYKVIFLNEYATTCFKPRNKDKLLFHLPYILAQFAITGIPPLSCIPGSDPEPTDNIKYDDKKHQDIFGVDDHKYCNTLMQHITDHYTKFNTKRTKQASALLSLSESFLDIKNNLPFNNFTKQNNQLFRTTQKVHNRSPGGDDDMSDNFCTYDKANLFFAKYPRYHAISTDEMQFKATDDSSKVADLDKLTIISSYPYMMFMEICYAKEKGEKPAKDPFIYELNRDSRAATCYPVRFVLEFKIHYPLSRKQNIQIKAMTNHYMFRDDVQKSDIDLGYYYEHQNKIKDVLSQLNSIKQPRGRKLRNETKKQSANTPVDTAALNVDRQNYADQGRQDYGNSIIHQKKTATKYESGATLFENMGNNLEDSKNNIFNKSNKFSELLTKKKVFEVSGARLFSENLFVFNEVSKINELKSYFSDQVSTSEEIVACKFAGKSLVKVMHSVLKNNINIRYPIANIFSLCSVSPFLQNPDIKPKPIEFVCSCDRFVTDRDTFLGNIVKNVGSVNIGDISINIDKLKQLMYKNDIKEICEPGDSDNSLKIIYRGRNVKESLFNMSETCNKTQCCIQFDYALTFNSRSHSMCFSSIRPSSVEADLSLRKANYNDMLVADLLLKHYIVMTIECAMSASLISFYLDEINKKNSKNAICAEPETIVSFMSKYGDFSHRNILVQNSQNAIFYISFHKLPLVNFELVFTETSDYHVSLALRNGNRTSIKTLNKFLIDFYSPEYHMSNECSLEHKGFVFCNGFISPFQDSLNIIVNDNKDRIINIKEYLQTVNSQVWNFSQAKMTGLSEKFTSQLEKYDKHFEAVFTGKSAYNLSGYLSTDLASFPLNVVILDFVLNLLGQRKLQVEPMYAAYFFELVDKLNLNVCLNGDQDDVEDLIVDPILFCPFYPLGDKSDSPPDSVYDLITKIKDDIDKSMTNEIEKYYSGIYANPDKYQPLEITAYGLETHIAQIFNLHVRSEYFKYEIQIVYSNLLEMMSNFIDILDHIIAQLSAYDNEDEAYSISAQTQVKDFNNLIVKSFGKMSGNKKGSLKLGCFYRKEEDDVKEQLETDYTKANQHKTRRSSVLFGKDFIKCPNNYLDGNDTMSDDKNDLFSLGKKAGAYEYIYYMYGKDDFINFKALPFNQKLLKLKYVSSIYLWKTDKGLRDSYPQDDIDHFIITAQVPTSAQETSAEIPKDLTKVAGSKNTQVRLKFKDVSRLKREDTVLNSLDFIIGRKIKYFIE